MIERDYEGFDGLAAMWRARMPAPVMSRGAAPISLVTGRKTLDEAIERAAADLAAALARGASGPILLGRTPHVLSMLSGDPAGVRQPTALLIDETVIAKVFRGKHGGRHGRRDAADAGARHVSAGGSDR